MQFADCRSFSHFLGRFWGRFLGRTNHVVHPGIDNHNFSGRHPSPQKCYILDVFWVIHIWVNPTKRRWGVRSTWMWSLATAHLHCRALVKALQLSSTITRPTSFTKYLSVNKKLCHVVSTWLQTFAGGRWKILNTVQPLCGPKQLQQKSFWCSKAQAHWFLTTSRKHRRFTRIVHRPHLLKHIPWEKESIRLTSREATNWEPNLPMIDYSSSSVQQINPAMFFTCMKIKSELILDEMEEFFQ